eukprot:SAG31_NODE_5860_length_2285_cov_1.997713_3_plen_105_part_00
MPNLGAFQITLDQAAAQCQSSSCPCQNGGRCVPSSSGSEHRRQLAERGQTCACSPGFGGDLCETAVEQPQIPGCQLNLPYLTNTLEGILDPGKWKAVRAPCHCP